MANKKYEEADIQAIATAIREKTGTDKLYDTSEMASGVNEVYEAGKTKERSDFWDDYLSFPQGYNAMYWFAGGGWKKSNFKPTKDFYVCSQMFYCHNYGNGENAYDLATHLEELGVKITHVMLFMQVVLHVFPNSIALIFLRTQPRIGLFMNVHIWQLLIK